MIDSSERRIIMRAGRIETFRSGHACPEPKIVLTTVVTSILSLVIEVLGSGHACPQRMIAIRRVDRKIVALAASVFGSGRARPSATTSILASKASCVG
jgi:hypothetical protein